MLFNSFEFAIFLPVVFLLYWFVFNRNLKLQNFFILVVSYVFYGWWDWRFLLLIFISSLVDYLVGLHLSNTEVENKKKRKILLIVSLVVNLGILGFFKYFDFFVDSFVSTFSLFGSELNPTTLGILLPVGISFYTLQTLSYTIEVYRGNISPTRNPIAFFAFVSFFPQLVAGPIERAKNLLPQFLNKRSFDYDNAKDGIKQIAWGLFKKIAIADTLAIFVNQIFDAPVEMSSGTLIVGMIFFAIQIYADFSGYSDIAIGTAKLFGFNLMINFKYPFFARDIAEFWRRWHISLTTWFRDYVYFPMGGSRVGTAKTVRNIFAVFVLSGLWHGAAINFIIWGIFHAIYYMPIMFLGKQKEHLGDVAEGRSLPNIKEVSQMVGTFLLFAFSMIFFRSETFGLAIIYIRRMLSFLEPGIVLNAWPAIPVLVFLFVMEWKSRFSEHPLQLKIKEPWIRNIIYFVVFYLTVMYISNTANEFIYFQF